MPAPSVVVYKDAFAVTSAATNALTSRTVAAGDVVAVVVQIEDNSVTASSLAKTAGTATIGTITKQRDAGTASHAGNVLFTFTVTGSGTLTLTVTWASTPTSRHFTVWTYVATGSGGVGNTAMTTTSVTTITASLSTSANSYVLALAADWNATGGATTTLTPSGGTLDAHEQDGVNDGTAAGSFFSSRGGHWSDSGAPATTSYGVTVPTSAAYNLVVCELLGVGGLGGGVVPHRGGQQWRRRFRHRQRPLAFTPTSAGVQAGPPVFPMEHPLQAMTPLTPRGRITTRSGRFAQQGPPVRVWHAPVQAKSYPPPTGGRISWRAGVYAQAGPRITPPDTPVRARVPRRERGGRAIHRTGVYSQQGPPLTPDRSPLASVARALPVRGRSFGLDGIRANAGPPVYAPHGPVIARVLPARGGRTVFHAGTFTSTAVPTAPFYRLPYPVQARLPVQLRGRIASHSGVYAQLGPPLRPQRSPLQATQSLPAHGRTISRTGTWTFVVIGAGAPFYRLPYPVQARRQIPRGGSVSSRAGRYAQTGPPLRPQTSPVRGRPGAVRGGSIIWRAGIFTGVGVQAGPPFYRLPYPVQARRLPARGGSITMHAGRYSQLGPPFRQITQPLQARRPNQFAGRTEGRTGVFGRPGPQFYRLTRPARARRWPTRGGISIRRAGTLTTIIQTAFLTGLGGSGRTDNYAGTGTHDTTWGTNNPHTFAGSVKIDNANGAVGAPGPVIPDSVYPTVYGTHY